MKFVFTYICLACGAFNMGLWMESFQFGIGVMLLGQTYLIANDLPKP